ncbi:neural cell adhesion molecule 2-like [Varroa destructor]|uniref:Ig-like domain-containing protein n=2 Tax=Varroa TaxID=62624 RepID=A0A7M7JKV0_VARDE|nr:neural cell adhesion molecule 2-like [Varroa destructor]
MVFIVILLICSTFLHGLFAASSEMVQLTIQGLHRVKSGRSLVLTCTLLEGKDVSFSWFKDGRMLKPGDKITIVPTDENSILSVSKVSSQDSGMYACLGSNRVAEERVERRVFVEGDHLF